MGSWLAGEVWWIWVTHEGAWVSPWFYWVGGYATYEEVSLHTDWVLSGLGIGILLLGVFLSQLPIPIPNLYGRARFATFAELRRAGLFRNQGIVIGKLGHRWLSVPGYEHGMVFGPSGSGKTAALSILNLLWWTGSLICNDLKHELYRLTSHFRHHILKQAVYRYAPGDPEGLTHCFNPLDFISQNPLTRIDDIQKLALIFIPEQPHTAPIWAAQSRLLFMALILYVLDTESLPNTLATVLHLVKGKRHFVEWVNTILQERPVLDPICRYNFNKFVEIHEETRQSILASFLSCFELFDNPLIAYVTSKSDFDIRTLREKKMTIYVGVTNDNLVRLAPLLSIFYQQVSDMLTRTLPKSQEHGVLLLMDEFSALKRMEIFQKNIGLYREYKVRVLLMVQEISQLYELYGREGAKIFINSKLRVVFAQNDEETAKLLETLMGTQTIAYETESRKKSWSLFDFQNAQESLHYTARPLLRAQEIRELPKHQLLILLEGLPPFLVKKSYWFQQKCFARFIQPPLELPSILPALQVYWDSLQKLLAEELKESANPVAETSWEEI